MSHVFVIGLKITVGVSVVTASVVITVVAGAYLLIFLQILFCTNVIVCACACLCMIIIICVWMRMYINVKCIYLNMPFKWSFDAFSYGGGVLILPLFSSCILLV